MIWFLCLSFIFGLYTFGSGFALVSDEVNEQLINSNYEDWIESEKDPLNSCLCANNICNCCHEVNVPRIRFKSEVCVKVEYLPAESGLIVSLSLNKHLVFKKKISASHPPKLCMTLPWLSQTCIELYDIVILDKKMSACIRLTIKILFKTYEVSLGCFNTIKIQNIMQFQTMETKEVFQQSDQYFQDAIVIKDSGIEAEEEVLTNNMKELNKHLIGSGINKYPLICKEQTCYSCLNLNSQISICANITVFNILDGQLTITLNKMKIYQALISDLQKICFLLESSSLDTKLCLFFYNISITSQNIQGCLLLNIGRSTENNKDSEIPLGCAEFNFQNENINSLYKTSDKILLSLAKFDFL